MARTNEIPNPKAGTDTSGWVDDSYGDVARVTSAPVALPDGFSTAFSCGPASTGSALWSDYLGWPGGWPAHGACYLYAQCEVYVDTPGTGTTMDIAVAVTHGNPDNLLATVYLAQAATPPGSAFQRYTAVLTVPDGSPDSCNTFDFQVTLNGDGTSADGATIYATGFQVELGEVGGPVPDYADGDSPFWSWEGTEQESRSVATPKASSELSASGGIDVCADCWPYLWARVVTAHMTAGGGIAVASGTSDLDVTDGA